MDKILIQNPDGTSTSISHISSESGKSSATIIIFPAMGVRGSYYEGVAKQLGTEGFNVIITDLRGIGQSSVRASPSTDFGYHEMLEQDYKSIVNGVKEHFPNQKIFALGHSLGGQLASLFLAKNPKCFDGLILIACCSVYYKGWGWKQYPTLLMTQFFYLVSVLLGYFPGKRMGFGGTEAKSVMQDWSQQSRSGKYIVKNDSFNYEKGLSKVTTKTLVLSFQADTYAPKKAVENLTKKFNSNPNLEHIHLMENDPRNEHFGHFNWAKKPKSIVKLVKGFIEGFNL